MTAVDGLGLEVKSGELFGLVGPDGAGKTTVMRLLAGILRPTSGEAWVEGHSIIHESERIKEKIGYMSQRFGLYEDLTVMENLVFYADLYETPQKERPGRIERLLTFSNLAPFTDRLAGALSGGMKQKLGLACALIHTPKVLLLDEPTNGVDPVSRRDFWRILYAMLREGVTIFVSTAYLDEAERFGRVGFLDKGKLLVTDDPKAIKNSLGRPMFELTADNARAAAQIAVKTPGVAGANVYGHKAHVSTESHEVAELLKKALTEGGVQIKDWRQITPSLEDMFISMVER